QMQNMDFEFTIIHSYRLLKHLSRAVKYAHMLGIVHHEIDSKNVRIKGLDLKNLDQKLDRCQFKLCNFGFSRSYPNVSQEDARQVTMITGQLPTIFTSPEKRLRPLLPSNPFLADVYSLGMVVFSSLAGKQRIEDHLHSNKSILSLIEECLSEGII